MHSHINPGVTNRYYPIQVASARRFARDILTVKHEKEALPQAVRLNFAQTILKMVYGIDVDSHESDYVSLPEKVLEKLAKAMAPGRYLVDAIPICKPFTRNILGLYLSGYLVKHVPAWFPGAGFQRLAQELQALQRRMLDTPIGVVRAQMVSIRACSCSFCF
jgi:hypothetical protein